MHALKEILSSFSKLYPVMPVADYILHVPQLLYQSDSFRILGR